MKVSRAVMPMLLAALLVGCGMSTAKDDAPVQPTADIAAAPLVEPATPAAAPAAAPADALAIAARSYADGEPPLTLVDGADDQSPRYFDVIDCAEEMRAADPGGAAPRPDEIVARRVALLRRSLRLVGYSAAVIDGPLADYGAAAARAADPDRGQDNYARLAAALDAKRTRLQPDLPPIRAEGGCGAAETPILVKTRPAGGHVWLITKFAFDLCRARRIDAWDRTDCDRWSEIGPDRPVQLSGNYVYQARWPSGPPARGNRRIDPVTDEEDADTPPTIIVDQP